MKRVNKRKRNSKERQKYRMLNEQENNHNTPRETRDFIH